MLPESTSRPMLVRRLALSLFWLVNGLSLAFMLWLIVFGHSPFGFHLAYLAGIPFVATTGGVVGFAVWVAIRVLMCGWSMGVRILGLLICWLSLTGCIAVLLTPVTTRSDEPMMLAVAAYWVIVDFWSVILAICCLRTITGWRLRQGRTQPERAGRWSLQDILYLTATVAITLAVLRLAVMYEPYILEFAMIPTIVVSLVLFCGTLAVACLLLLSIFRTQSYAARNLYCLGSILLFSLTPPVVFWVTFIRPAQYGVDEILLATTFLATAAAVLACFLLIMYYNGYQLYRIRRRAV